MAARRRDRRALPAAVSAIDMVGSLALLFAVAYGLTRLAVLGQAPPAVARAPQADPVVRVRGRRPRDARHHLLPAGRAAAVLQRELVPRAVAHAHAHRPGALPGADRRARGPAHDDDRGAPRNAGAPAVERRVAVSVHLDDRRAVVGAHVPGRAGARGPRPAHAAGDAAGQRRAVGASRCAASACRSGSAARASAASSPTTCRPPAPGRRRGPHPAGDARRGAARNAQPHVGRGPRPAACRSPSSSACTTRPASGWAR